MLISSDTDLVHVWLHVTLQRNRLNFAFSLGIFKSLRTRTQVRGRVRVTCVISCLQIAQNSPG